MKYRYVNTEYGSLRSTEIRSIMLWSCRSPEYCINSTGSVLIGSSADGAAPDGDAADAVVAAILAHDFRSKETLFQRTTTRGNST